MSCHAITRREFVKSAALAAAAAFVPVSGTAQAASGVIRSNDRRLVEGWEYCRRALGGMWAVWRPDQLGDVALDMWQPAAMPHCFNARDAVDPDQPYYQGSCWYRTRVNIENPFRSGRTLLHFEGAGQKSTVFLYMEKVGEHLGGYDEFNVDITEAANGFLKNRKSNEPIPIAVLCDNAQDLEAIPSSFSDFNHYGGLYRYVNLKYVPAVSLEQVHITPQLLSQESASVSIKARLYNPDGLDDQLHLSMKLLDPQGVIVYVSEKQLVPWKDEMELWSWNVKKPTQWSPSNPSLYGCEITLSGVHGEMTIHERFGIRQFEFVPQGPFRFNGERLLLRGTSRHEDHALLGAAMPDDLIRKEMQLIKDMGANFIRLGHYQQSRTVLDLCDELGLLVWEEIPWCRGGLGGEDYKNQARNMLRAMIDQHYNHPSVIVWGVGNENDWPGDFPDFDKGKIRAFMQELHGEAHRLDPTRKTGTRRCDFAKDVVDVYSPSLWAGWYRHIPYPDYRRLAQREMEQVRHFLHIEWGADGHAGRHSEDQERFLLNVLAERKSEQEDLSHLLAGPRVYGAGESDWSETYACNVFDWHLKEQETMPWLTGSAQWIFKDFSTPLRPSNPIPYVNQKGLTERDLTLKESYYVFQSYWIEAPMIHIYGHSWPIRWGDSEEVKLIKVYSNCETAELLLNNISCGEKKRNSQDFPAAGLRWQQKFKPGENHLRVIGKKNGITVTDELHFHYQTERWSAPARLALSQNAHDSDIVTVEARLLDARGTQCLDARSRLHFSISGDGALIDNCGTSQGSRSIELRNGRAEIRLRTGGGKSVVSAQVKGVPTVFLLVL
jgi:beta-galactosidase